MKQKIKSLFTNYLSIHNPHDPALSGKGWVPRIHIRKAGFTLIELAMVLVVIGLLIGIGASLIGPMTKRAKIIETRETVKAAKEAVIGWTIKNSYLPSNIAAAGGKNKDSWGKDLLYIPAAEIDTSSENVCRTIAAPPNNKTTLNVCLNGDCSTQRISNIAFVIVSGDGNFNIQTWTSTPAGCPAGETCIVIYDAGAPNIDNYTTDMNRPEEYDDIVQYASLDEIRTLMGCSQPLAVTSPTSLPQGEEDSFYSYSMQAIGGKPPYTWTAWGPTSGLSLNTSGLISGTINYNAGSSTGELANCSGSISVNTSVTDSAGSTAVLYNGTISVRPKPLVITNTELPSTTVGTVNANFADLDGTGGRSSAYFWTLSGAPSWLSINSSTGALGVNNPPAAGTYSFTATLSDGCGSSTSKRYSITVNS